MARQDNDRVERPPPRRRIVTGEQPAATARTRGDQGSPGPFESPRDEPNSPSQSDQRGNDPLADLAPVYSVDELAPVYGASPTTPQTTGSTPPTRSVRSQPPPARPPRPERGPTPGSTPVNPRPATTVNQSRSNDSARDADDDDEGRSTWPRIAILTAGLLASLGLIAYGVSGMFGTSTLDADTESEEGTEQQEPTSDSALDLQPVTIQGEPLDLEDVSLPEGQLQIHRVFDYGEATALVATHPGNEQRTTVATLDRASKTWTVAPTEVVFSAVGPSPDGLIGVADNAGAFSLVQSGDGGASWAPVDGASELPSSDLDLIARNDAGIVFTKRETPGDHRGEASEILAAAGIELPTNMVAGVSSQTVTYFEAASEETSWWLLPSYTATWADFGLEPQTQWAAYSPESPRQMYRWAGEAIEEVPDPFGADQFLLTLDTVVGEFRAVTYDATAVGFSEWRSPDGLTWTPFGSLTRPPFSPAPASAVQRVSLDGIEWQILTLPEREPVIARRVGSTEQWTVVEAADVVEGTDLDGYTPVSLSVTDRVLTLTLDAPEGKASVVAQSTDASSWKVADISAPHVEARVDSGSLIAFGVGSDPAAGPPTLNAVSVG